MVDRATRVSSAGRSFFASFFSPVQQIVSSVGCKWTCGRSTRELPSPSHSLSTPRPARLRWERAGKRPRTLPQIRFERDPRAGKGGPERAARSRWHASSLSPRPFSKSVLAANAVPSAGCEHAPACGIERVMLLLRLRYLPRASWSCFMRPRACSPSTMESGRASPLRALGSSSRDPISQQR